MSIDPALSPSLVSEFRELKQRIVQLESRLVQFPSSIPAVPLGAVRDFGWSSFDSTTFVDVFRADVYVSAPLLDIDVQVSSFWGTGITTVEWQINANNLSDGIPGFTVVASGGGVGGTQDQQVVDLRDTLGADVLFKRVRFDVEVKRTGGSGDAAVRLVKPLTLRVA